ncbi:MAG TPA: DUF4142 domain-containing protein [Noviherbaspirillum sp.]|uniref:DUF4142 domain-containing protein n=1 Tax=Noviherbaspirillum sp. TaxID=1926288 RepID=UPI002F93CAD0
MSRMNMRVAGSGMLAACAMLAQVALAQDGVSDKDAHDQRNRGDAARGSAATAPSSGGTGISGGRTNAMGDSKANDAGSTANEKGASALQPGPTGKARVSNADARLMREFAQAHLAEIKMSGLATAVSDNQAVRAFATKMLEEHYRALDHLKQLATNTGVILPGGVATPHAEVLRKLTLLTGREFNDAYMQQAGLGLHAQSHELFQSAAKAQSPELKSYAASWVPVIEEHRQLAQAMLDDPSNAAAAVQATVRAGQSIAGNANLSMDGRRDGNSGSSGDKGSANIAGHPAGVVK